FGLLTVAFATSSSYWLALGFLFLMGFCNDMYMTTVNTSLQLMVPNEFRGRVMGLWGLTWNLVPIGGTFAGAIAQVAGAPTALAIDGALVACMATGVALAIPRIWRLELSHAIG